MDKQTLNTVLEEARAIVTLLADKLETVGKGLEAHGLPESCDVLWSVYDEIESMQAEIDNLP